MTGRYFQDWLLLDSDWNWRLQPDRGGALRAVGDIGSHWLDLMTFVTGQHVASVMAELTTFIGTRREPTGPVETFSTDRSAETVERRDRDRGHRRHPAALRRRRAGRREHLPDQPRPEELARLRDRRVRRSVVVGQRAARPGVGRPSRATQRDPHPQPGPDGCRRAGRVGPAGRPCRRLLRHVLRPFPGRVRRRGSRGGPPPRPATRRSPTATTRCSSARRSRAAPTRAAGSTSNDPASGAPAARPVPTGIAR